MKKSSDNYKRQNSNEFRNSLTAPLSGGSSLFENNQNNNNTNFSYGSNSGVGTPLVGKLVYQQGAAAANDYNSNNNNGKMGLSNSLLSSSLNLGKGGGKLLRGLENIPGSSNNNIGNYPPSHFAGTNGNFSLLSSSLPDEVISAEDNSSFLLSLQRNVEKAQKPVAGSQFHLPNKAMDRCEYCIDSEKSLKKSKEMIRGLKLQISRLEDKYIGLKKSKTSEPNTGDGEFAVEDVEELKVLKEQLQTRCDSQELELSKLKKTYNKEKLLVDECKENIETLMKRISSLESDAATANANYALTLKLKDENIQHLTDQLNDLTKKLNDMQSEMKLNSKNKESENKIFDLTQALEKLQKEYNNANDKNKQFNLRVANLEDLEKATTEALNKLKVEHSMMEDELKAQKNELDSTLIQFGSTKMHCEELVNDYRSAKAYQVGLENNLQNATATIEDIDSKNESLSREIDRLNKSQSDLMSKLARTSEANKRALELAVAGSVRLCVVAPTVNVHISDKKLKLKGSLSDKTLTDFLTTEVLSKYSFLFKQMAEDLSPEGSSLSAWIQKMLTDMQRSIESHVNSAMEPS